MIRVIGKYVYIRMSLYTSNMDSVRLFLAPGQHLVVLIRHYIDFDCIFILKG